MKGIYFIVVFLFLGAGITYSAPKSKAKKVDAEEVLKKGREAFLNYDFEEAADLYDEYRELKTKAKQPLDEEFEIWESELEIATNAFDRVQKIIIVDSISVPASKFYEAYKLNASAGDLISSESAGGINMDNQSAFKNEMGDLLIYPKMNEEGDIRLYEKSQLLDGNWEEKESLEGDFEKDGDYSYPFMSADGQTFYFANNGEESMGGYDIFVAQKDALTGEFLQPLNLGMPFNSPYDDIMLAIDEESGLGWWATNRNSFEDRMTIYVFLYNDLRKNYPADTENLAEYAKITDFKATWTDDKFEPITPIMPSLTKTLHAEEKSGDFEFSLGNGKTYYKLTDFKNRKASDLMKQYLNKKNELEKKEVALSELRGQWKSNKSLGNKIIQGEEEIEELRAQTKALKSEVLRLEKSVR